jgi:predicted metal-dependent hydrolase
MTVTAFPITANKQAFKQRVRHWARKLDVPVAWLAIRPMRQKWASCSTNGHLHFSTELLSLDPELWDYVIVHELLHFSIPNHGRLWKALMRAHLGDWESAAERLQRTAATTPFSSWAAPRTAP